MKPFSTPTNKFSSTSGAPPTPKAASARSKNIRLINVNIDDNESLSRAIAKADGIAHSHRIHGSLAEKIRREFRLPDNCGGALLIASDGTVSAANPEF